MTICGSMLEVLGYLRANGYKTFIATGGTAGFHPRVLRMVAQPVASSTI
jgi:hypothetical protein